MPFGLTIGTERANALQQCIQDELMQRGYSPDADPVMAEYITIMVINNKTAAQITTELEDLIGSEYDAAFTDWLFAEAAKGASGPEVPSQPQPPTPSAQPVEPTPASRDPPPHITRDTSSRPSHTPRNGLYQQAVSQATSSHVAQKRTASARSPSPNHPNKSRRTDLPTGPRAMAAGPGPTSRSLLDRMGGHANNNNAPARRQHDEVQARIDNITNNSGDPAMMMAGGFPGMPMGGMDMNAMAMANPLVLQEMFVNNMALMQQLSSQIGIMQGFANGAVPFNMQGGVPGDINMFPGGTNNMAQANPRGRTPGRGRGTGRGRGGSHASTRPDGSTGTESTPITTPLAQQYPDVGQAPVMPTPVAPVPVVATPEAQLPYAVPDRPQSPTLCKFGLKCTNAHCRWSHPSPVATAESGVVLSNEACESGKNCKDKDCIKAHVSPAVLNPPAQPSIPTPAPVVHHTPSNSIPCRFGLACTRPNCVFTHPRPTPNTHALPTPCRFGAACTRANCTFKHPEGRVLPTTFHRGLSTTAPMVNVPTPETGSMGASHHKSVVFNNSKAKLEKQVKELEEKKNEAEKAVKEAEAQAAATNGKQDEPKPVATAA